MTDPESRAERIAELNDEFRRHAGLATTARVSGRCFMTAGVAAFDPLTVPNYNRKTDRHHFGTLIGITSES